MRGVAIVEMIAAHYAPYFPVTLARLIGYAETAMPLFVVVAGFIVGWGCRRFAQEPRAQTWTVWKRAGRLLAIQYFMILTISVPLHLLEIPGNGVGQSTGQFVIESLLFLNQISLIHILPTFIPLFLVSPLVLLALSRGWDKLLVAISASLFCVGHFHPHLLDLSQPTIFPFVLFQFYFVIGCLLGKRTAMTGALPPPRPRYWLVLSSAALVLSLLIVYEKVIPAGFVQTHPLNLFGLMYQVPIIATLWLASLVFWPRVQARWVYPYFTLFGRHALLAFVIHVYLAKALSVLDYFVVPPTGINYALIFLSIVLMSVILRRYEAAKTQESPPMWARVAHGLFK